MALRNISSLLAGAGPFFFFLFLRSCGELVVLV